MSVVGVCRSVPSPQSDLYRYPWASTSESIVSRNPGQGQVEESKMSLSSGAPIFSPSTSVSTHKETAQPAHNGNGDAQREPSSAMPLSQSEGTGQLGPQFSNASGLGLALNSAHPVIKDEKDGVITQHNQISQNWTSRDTTMGAPQPIQAGREPDIMGEENDDDLAEDMSNGEDGDGGQARSPNDGDDKKKTKRFRLTHNQTRFLMSEFTRQAHPDAAHRERLSREIPGLSPRQVQVWFQNRRAKLKRLTSQDRDRVLKSRALPEHFDRTQMLHQPYNSRTSTNTSPTSPTAARASFASSGPKPLAVSHMKRNPGEDYPVSPASAASAYGNYVNSPGLSESFSPNPNNAANTATLPRVPGVHGSHPHDYGRSHSFSSSYAPSAWHQYPQRLHMPHTESAIKTEQALNPIHRPTASYPGLAGTIPETGYARHSSQASSVDHATATQTNSSLPPGMAYQAGQQHATSEQYPSSSQAVADSHSQHDTYHAPVNYRHVLSLQTAQLPPPQEYQVSPFTPSYNFDSFYQHYTHDNSSAVSLPASYMRSSQTGYESPTTGYSYENNDINNRLAASQPGGAR